MIIKIKKIIFKILLINNLSKLSNKSLNRLYNLYDYSYLDNELKQIDKEFRVRYIDNMLHNNTSEFIFHFGNFKTADMWINNPWKLEKYEKMC